MLAQDKEKSRRKERQQHNPYDGTESFVPGFCWISRGGELVIWTEIRMLIWIRLQMHSPVQARRAQESQRNLWLTEIDESTPPFSFRVSKSVLDRPAQNNSRLVPYYLRLQIALISFI